VNTEPPYEESYDFYDRFTVVEHTTKLDWFILFVVLVVIYTPCLMLIGALVGKVYWSKVGISAIPLVIATVIIVNLLRKKSPPPPHARE
jgi:Fe2+ transport system protein B